jgi:hypothetical protein
MADAERISERDLKEIAAKVGNRLWALMDRKIPEDAAIELGESFSLWMLETEKIKQADWPDLRELVKPTHRWHHQIKIDGKGVAFARSTPPKDSQGSHYITELFAPSPDARDENPQASLAERIDEAIDWIDQNVKQDYLVHLLAVPAYQVNAFWLFDLSRHESQVVVIDSPPEFEELKRGKLFTSRQFLEAISKERIEPITGISDRRRTNKTDRDMA